MSVSERMEKRSCDNRYYIPNLTTALKRAIEQKDIETIIGLTRELENFKVLCGYTPAIQQFEESLKQYGRELNLLDRPEIKRALDIVPQKTCACENCKHEEKIDFTAAMRRGFSNIQGAVSPMAAPNLEEDHREQQYPEICNILCEHVTCPFRKQENFNKPCKQRWKPLRRSLNPDNMEE